MYWLAYRCQVSDNTFPYNSLGEMCVPHNNAASFTFSQTIDMGNAWCAKNVFGLNRDWWYLQRQIWCRCDSVMDSIMGMIIQPYRNAYEGVGGGGGVVV